MPGQNFVVYKSSAGSGKTFTLVREYLKIVLQNPDLFRNVLAITFTNKAANEMKERVVRYLVELASPDRRKSDHVIQHLTEQLTGALKMTEEQIGERAQKVLNLILHQYSEFSVSTIDSFTHRVIRTFAHDLEIPMNFEVELESETMLEEAIDELISLAGTDPKLTRILVSFVENKAEDELNWQIEKDLNEFGKALLNEDSIEFVSALRQYDLDVFVEIRRKLYLWKSQLEQKLREMARDMLRIADKVGLDYDAVFQKKKGVLTYLEGLGSDGSEVALPNSFARKCLETGEWLGSKVSSEIQSKFEAVKPDLLGKGNDVIALVDKEYPRYSVCRLLLQNLYSTALLGEIEKILYTNCQEQNKVLISEFNRRISGIVREQPAPFIYERLGERYQHYLIDEFQDTSVLQWHNLLPLVENALASHRLNLVVGDAKQAIYRWRAGDARQFEMLPRILSDSSDPILKNRERALVEHFKEENLDKNHRSSPVIVNFNNRFFREIVTLLPDGHNEPYTRVAQDPARKQKPGMVHIEIIRKDEETDLSYFDQVLNKTLEFIVEIRSDGYPLKDIAVLCRENKKAAAIAAFLIRNGINVISSESLLLTQSENVNFMVAWARHLAFKNDLVALSVILHYLLSKGYISSDEFDRFYLDNSHEVPFSNGEKLSLFLDRFEKLLHENLPEFKYHDLKNFDLQGFFRYLAVYFELDLNAESYLRFFMDMVMEFMKKNHGGIPEFIDWWEEKSQTASLIIPEGIDAVRIMTIHKAKGLQFPVVIYPFADEECRPTRKNLWVTLEEELARPLSVAYLPTRKSLEGTVYEPLYKEEVDRSGIDLANVLYVAMTRPEERLYVITKTLPEKTDGTLSVAKLFSHFFRVTGDFAQDKTSYFYGERVKKEGTAIEEIPGDIPSHEPFKGRASLNLMLRKHAPDAWDMEEAGDLREWGIILHNFMSRISYASDIPQIVEEMLVNGEITKQQASSMQLLAENLVRDPQLSALFEPGYEVLNEAEIITREGRIFRPDRIMVKGKEAVIVEYKTGEARPAHQEQVRNYVGLLREMDYLVNNAWLVYLDIDHNSHDFLLI